MLCDVFNDCRYSSTYLQQAARSEYGTIPIADVSGPPITPLTEARCYAWQSAVAGGRRPSPTTMRSSIVNRLRSLRAPLAASDGRSLSDHQHDQRNAGQPNHHGLLFRLADTFSRTWDLGFTAFGGPPVHFQIMHRRFVQPTGGKVAWVDEQTVDLSSSFAFTPPTPFPARRQTQVVPG